jgi:hypothetical protein
VAEVLKIVEVIPDYASKKWGAREEKTKHLLVEGKNTPEEVFDAVDNLLKSEGWVRIGKPGLQEIGLGPQLNQSMGQFIS